jgi:hypothetical protein
MIVAPFPWRRPLWAASPPLRTAPPRSDTPSRISLKKFRRYADLHPDGRALIRHWLERAFVTPRNGSFESFIYLRRGRQLPASSSAGSRVAALPGIKGRWSFPGMTDARGGPERLADPPILLAAPAAVPILGVFSRANRPARRRMNRSLLRVRRTWHFWGVWKIDPSVIARELGVVAPSSPGGAGALIRGKNGKVRCSFAFARVRSLRRKRCKQLV